MHISCWIICSHQDLRTRSRRNLQISWEFSSKSKMQEKIQRQCHWRIKAILRTKLNSFNRTEAANTLTTPALQCSFNIISWTLQDLRRTDTKIRKLITCHRMHHPKADKDQLYHPRCKGGRSVFQVEPKNRSSKNSRTRAIFTNNQRLDNEMSKTWKQQKVLPRS